MDNVKEAIASTVDRATTFCLWDCCIRTKGQWKLPTVNPFPVEAGLKNVFVVPETATPQSTMKFLRCPMGLGIRSIGSIARANRRKGRSLMMNKAGDIVT
jgi:hypothetical protein